MLRAVRLFGAAFLVGISHLVPGLSAGTVALCCGIYERLIASIASTAAVFRLGLCGRFRQARQEIDLLFTLTMAAGACVGILGFSHVLTSLMAIPLGLCCLYSGFLGLVVASLVYCARLVAVWTPLRLLACLASAAAVSLCIFLLKPDPFGVAEPSFLRVICGGALAAPALLLPGISGAFVLQIFGLYRVSLQHVATFASGLATGHMVLDSLIYLCLLGAGVAAGLMLSAQAIGWLLRRFRAMALAVLLGCAVGALGLLWPFRGVDPLTLSLVWSALGSALGGLFIGLALHKVRDRTDQLVPSGEGQ